MTKCWSLFLVLPLIASCVAPSSPPPRPVAAPAPVATPAPLPAPVTVDRFTGDWSVADLSPGEWRYNRAGAASVARFAVGSQAPLASISCSGGQVTLARSGVIPADMAATLNIRSSFAERNLPIRVSVADRTLTATLAGRDPMWDQIMYSRGRFLIEATRQPPLLVPTRPEVARVIEDCRR